MSKLIRRFIEVLEGLDRGALADALDRHLGDALGALDEAPGNTAKATITLTMTFARKGDRVDLQPAIKSKLPDTVEFGASPFWIKDGALSMQHPQQDDMFGGGDDAGPRLAVVPGPDDVDDDAGPNPAG